MVRWGEILAATTVALLIYHTLNRSSVSRIVGENRNYLPRRTSDIIDRPEVQEKILNITPYREYDNLVVRNGRVVGGL